MLHRALACLAVLPKNRPESISTLSPEEVLHSSALSLSLLCGSGAATGGIRVAKPSLLTRLSSHLRCMGGTRAASRRGKQPWRCDRLGCCAGSGGRSRRQHFVRVRLLAAQPTPCAALRRAWPRAGGLACAMGALGFVLGCTRVEQGPHGIGQLAGKGLHVLP